MRIKINKTAVSAVISYIALTVGLWMFLLCYTNSYNRLSEYKITPASFSVEYGRAELDIIGHKYVSDADIFSPDNKACLIAYIIAPDELRGALLLFSDIKPLKQSGVKNVFPDGT
jgi:hypothetical protein